MNFLKTFNSGSVIFALLTAMTISCGRNIKYTDVTVKSGIDFRYNFGDHHYENIIESSGSGVTVSDYNSDGLMDLFMMNGTYLEGISSDDGLAFKDTPDNLYRNNGDGTFTDVTTEAGVYDIN